MRSRLLRTSISALRVCAARDCFAKGRTSLRSVLRYVTDEEMWRRGVTRAGAELWIKFDGPSDRP
jgi:hypothetical protein